MRRWAFRTAGLAAAFASETMEDIRSVRDREGFERCLLDELLQSTQGFVLWRALMLLKADLSRVRLQHSLIKKVGPMNSLPKTHSLTRLTMREELL